MQACLQVNNPSVLKLAVNIAKKALELESSVCDAVTKSLEHLIIRLRSKALMISEETYKEDLRLDKNGRLLDYIQNDYEDQDEVVFDHATGLMWQKSGSDTDIPYEKIQEYIKTLNQKRFAGYDDWRLPTLPELMSLIEPGKQLHDLYVNPIFDEKQWCWSAKLSEGETGAAWLIYFSLGIVSWDFLTTKYSVSVVRS